MTKDEEIANLKTALEMALEVLASNNGLLVADQPETPHKKQRERRVNNAPAIAAVCDALAGKPVRNRRFPEQALRGFPQ